MRLWTEYEGETIDGAFPLKRLLLPEGRSAFFSTANGKGDPALLRLIECHFDEDEIIARWRCIEALSHPNFLKLERFGQIELDGGPGVYALFEKADANLAEVLAQDRLSVKDTAQLAASLVAALEMLHTHGFVHEHVAAQNIFAVGEIVKLRSDCIREAPEGHAGADAKQRDVRDMAIVVLQALTQAVDAERAMGLPAPFDKIVRNGMSGAWGLAEIRLALGIGQRSSPVTPKPDPVASAPRPASPKPASEPVVAAGAVPKAASAPAEPTAAKAPVAAPQASAPAAKPPQAKPKENGEWRDNVVRSRMRQQLWEDTPRRAFELSAIPGAKWAGVAGMVVILCVMAGWLVAHESHHAAPAATVQAANRTAPAQPVPAPMRSTQSSQPASARAGQGRIDWRVIAYTYNHRDQAQKKAATLAKVHADLRPAVFTPTGRAPYLVTLGGVMSRDAAFAFARKVRGRGLPRDTYAQNYSRAAR